MDFGLFLFIKIHSPTQTRKFSPLIDPKICYIQLRFPECDFPSLVKQIYCVKTQNMQPGNRGRLKEHKWNNKTG